MGQWSGQELVSSRTDKSHARAAFVDITASHSRNTVIEADCWVITRYLHRVTRESMRLVWQLRAAWPLPDESRCPKLLLRPNFCSCCQDAPRSPHWSRATSQSMLYISPRWSRSGGSRTFVDPIVLRLRFCHVHCLNFAHAPAMSNYASTVPSLKHKESEAAEALSPEAISTF